MKEEYVVELPLGGTLYLAVWANSKAEAMRKVDEDSDDVEDLDSTIHRTGMARKATKVY